MSLSPAHCLHSAVRCGFCGHSNTIAPTDLPQFLATLRRLTDDPRADPVLGTTVCRHCAQRFTVEVAPWLLAAFRLARLVFAGEAA